MITFNNQIKLILSDVDETIAGVYLPAVPALIAELDKLLDERKVLFMTSGGSLQSIRERIIDKVNSKLRHRVLIAHCMGAEVWGFQNNGELNPSPYYGRYDKNLNEDQKKQWRVIVNDAVKRFKLQTFLPEPKTDFEKRSNKQPLAIMLADRGPQITLELVNAINLSEAQRNLLEKELNISIPLTHGAYDLRIVIADYLNDRYQKAGLPIDARIAGTFALDNILNGVDKTLAVRFILEHENILKNLEIHRQDIENASALEIWGDKFIPQKGGVDFDMCKAVSPKVRAIDFRKENSAEYPPGYNIQSWDGQRHLQEGLLEYLQSR